MKPTDLPYFDQIFQAKLLIDIFQNYERYVNQIAVIKTQPTQKQAEDLSKFSHFIAKESHLDIKGQTPNYFLNTPEKDNDRANLILELQEIYNTLIDFAVENKFERHKIIAWVEKRHKQETKIEMLITDTNFLNWCDAIMAFYSNHITSIELDAYLVEYGMFGKTSKQVNVKQVVGMAGKILDEYTLTI